MVKQLGDRAAVVSSKELGTNCWLAKRFIAGASRCERVFVCNYPERKTCQAVHAEIRHLMERQTELVITYKNIDHTIQMLNKMLEN